MVNDFQRDPSAPVAMHAHYHEYLLFVLKRLHFASSLVLDNYAKAINIKAAKDVQVLGQDKAITIPLCHPTMRGFFSSGLHKVRKKESNPWSVRSMIPASLTS